MDQGTRSKLSPDTPNYSSTDSHLESFIPEDFPKASILIDRQLSGQGGNSLEKPEGSTRRFEQLQAYLYDIYVLLERQKSDLNQLHSRTTEAAELIEQSQDFPGCEAMSAIQATLPIVQCAIDRNISTVSNCREMISAVQQAACSPEVSPDQTTLLPGSEPDAWDITYPGDDLFVDDESSDGEQNSKVCQIIDQQDFPLPYHPGVIDIDRPRLYMPRPRADVDLRAQSRRVLLSNLPPDTSISQILCGIRGYGGVVSVTMLASLPVPSMTKSALVEFTYPITANHFASLLADRRIIYLDAYDREYKLETWLIPTPSYFYSAHNYTALKQGRTRRLCMPSFPVDAVWHFISRIGVTSITDVELDANNTLFIETISLFEASRVERLYEYGNLDMPSTNTPNGLSYVPDSSQGEMNDIFAMNGGKINHVSADALERTWNVSPNNNYSSYKTSVAELVKQDGQPKASLKPLSPPLTNNEILAAQFDIDPDEVEDYLEERRNFQDVTYRIVGSTISITRRKWSWAISAEDNTKLLMAVTLHDPEWATEWDQHFAVRGEVNLRTWEQYGQLAAHRRARAISRGSEEWRVSTCADCPWGCRDMKQQPVPSVIREYFDFSKRHIGSDEDET